MRRRVRDKGGARRAQNEREQKERNGKWDRLDVSLFLPSFRLVIWVVVSGGQSTSIICLYESLPLLDEVVRPPHFCLS